MKTYHPSGIYHISDDEFHAVRQLIYDQAGIALSSAKRPLVCSRLAKRLRALGLNGYSAYLELLKSQGPRGQELQRMINCLTTNKTDFFREPHHFDFLRDTVFPEVKQRATRGAPRRLRIWSAGCSTGNEAYSIALTILEHFGSRRGWDIKVLGSDIDTDVLRVAIEGVYPLDSIDALPEHYKTQYFLRGTGKWAGCCQIRPEAKQLVAFRRVNFVADQWQVQTRFDVIFCRNVIIYFDVPTQQTLMPRLADKLVDDGYLMLGHSENLPWLTQTFVPLGNTAWQLKPRQNGTAKIPSVSAVKPVRIAGTKQHSGALRGTSSTTITSAPRQNIIVGQMFASAKPVEICTLLGSCVGACLFDPQAGVGGMNHFMLPDGASPHRSPAVFGVHAMELLINEIMKLGGDRRRLVAKLFGGANLRLFAHSSLAIGDRNSQFAQDFLQTEGIPLVARQLGGLQPRHVHFLPHTGQAFVKVLKPTMTVAERETRYSQRFWQNLQQHEQSNVTLF